MQGLQPHRHRERPRQGGERAVERAQAPVQHRGAAAARHAGGGGRQSFSSASPAGPRAGAAGRGAGAGGDPPDRHDLPRAAQRRHRRRQDQAQVAQRHAINRRGDLGGEQWPGARGALRRRPAERPTTWRRAYWRASSRIRCRTVSSGWNIWRRWSRSATAGRTCIAPVAR